LFIVYLFVNLFSQPEDIKEAHKDILERARAKGLLGGKKKQKKAVEPEPVVNGEVETEPEDEKLLEKRVKHSPRKLRTTQSHPGNFNYSRTSAISVVRTRIHGGRAAKSTASISISHVPRLRPLTEPLEKKEKPVKVAEHVKVVKHPAPFR
jgi:hypothetical protein